MLTAQDATARPPRLPEASVDLPTPVVASGSGRVRVFDLHRQETVERARLRRLQPILETVAHRIGSSLTSAIRQPVHVELMSLEQRTWEEHSSSLPDPTFVSSAVLLPLEGRLVLHLPVPLVLELIDFHLGGDALRQPDRSQLTEIERALVGTLTEVIWNELPPPFATLVSLNVGLVQNSSSPLLVQVGRPGVMCLIVELGVTIADRDQETVVLSIPLTVLLPVLEQVERHQSSEGMDGLVDHREARRRILSVPMELKVAYPPISLTPDELLGLRAGDVIHLGQEPSEGSYELQLVVQDTPFGTGILVEHGNKLFCTVVSKRESGDE
ncbi:MAG: flagellar motor switch protein FliM [Actinomycetota bacterium]|nr:flagellar motor switch protein FliM [Actinomycetota bacterium]